MIAAVKCDVCQSLVLPGHALRSYSMLWPGEPTILEGVPSRDYRADDFGDVPTLSRSIAHTLLTFSPMHAAAEHPRLPGAVKPKASKPMDAGSLHHAVILGEGEEELVVLPGQYQDFKTARAREIRDEAWAAGKSPVIAEDYELAAAVGDVLQIRICDAIGKVTGILPKWADFGRELVALWEEKLYYPDGAEPLHGVRCRARWDLYLPGAGLLADLKCVTGGQYASAAKSIRGLNSEEDSGAMQAAAYLRGLEAVNPELAGRTTFVFLRVEIAPPYAVVPIVVGTAMREHGEKLWERAVRGWARCMASGAWPEPGVAYAQLLPWAAQRDLDQAAEDGDAEP
jgi:hypothetical protein